MRGWKREGEGRERWRHSVDKTKQLKATLCLREMPGTQWSGERFSESFGNVKHAETPNEHVLGRLEKQTDIAGRKSVVSPLNTGVTWGRRGGKWWGLLIGGKEGGGGVLKHHGPWNANSRENI